MLEGQTPPWLNHLERKMSWLGVPNIAVLFVTLQALGFLMVWQDPVWAFRLALLPDRVLEGGEVWRLITFLAMPLSMSPIFVIFTLWFLYFIINSIESQWGEFKTTFYILIAIVVTIAFSLGFNYPVTQVTYIEASLFLAAAALFPNFEVMLFFAVPVKIRWLAWLTVGLLALGLLRGDWKDRLYFLAIFSNYLLFFGPAHYQQLRQHQRRKTFKRSIR